MVLREIVFSINFKVYNINIWVEKYKNYSKLYTLNIIKINNYSIDFKIY
jgi:hypothetical protein